MTLRNEKGHFLKRSCLLTLNKFSSIKAELVKGQDKGVEMRKRLRHRKIYLTGPFRKRIQHTLLLRLCKIFFSFIFLIIKGPPPPYFCVMRFFGVIFLRENVNLMYFVRDVVIESLVVIRYRVYFCK